MVYVCSDFEVLFLKTLFTETPRRCFGGCKYVNSLSKTYVPYCQSFLISNLKLRQKIPNKNKTNSHKFYYLDVETFAEKSKLQCGQFYSITRDLIIHDPAWIYVHIYTIDCGYFESPFL